MNLRKISLGRKQAGDTIVEVMMVLAVLGLSFGISYATANRSLHESRNSEERGQALAMLGKQVELLRTTVTSSETLVPSTDTAKKNKPFCLDENGKVAWFTMADGTENPACISSDKLYKMNIVFKDDGTSTGGVYVATINWDGVGTLGKQQVQLKYGLHSLAMNSDIDENQNQPTEPEIDVVVKKIPPNSDNTTPSCSNAATESREGTKIQLSGGGINQSVLTGGNSTAVFTGLINHGLYSATVTGVPTGYELCYNNSPSSSPQFIGSTIAQSNAIRKINDAPPTVKIRPICELKNIPVPTTKYRWVYTNDHEFDFYHIADGTPGWAGPYRGDFYRDINNVDHYQDYPGAPTPEQRLADPNIKMWLTFKDYNYAYDVYGQPPIPDGTHVIWIMKVHYKEAYIENVPTPTWVCPG